MPENQQPKTVTIGEKFEFPVTIKAPFGEVTLVGRVEFAHDVDCYNGFYVEGDPEGLRSILFLAWQEAFEVVE